MHAPDFTEHCPERETESDSQQPRAEIAGHREDGRRDESTVESSGYDCQQTQHDAQQHEIIAGRVRMLNDSPVRISKVEVNEQSREHAPDNHDAHHRHVDP